MRKLHWKTVESLGLRLLLKMAKEMTLEKVTRRLDGAFKIFVVTYTFPSNLHVWQSSSTWVRICLRLVFSTILYNLNTVVFPKHWTKKMYVYWKSLGNIIVCHEPVTDPRSMPIHVQSLCTGQRITKEMFTGNAGVKFCSLQPVKWLCQFAELKSKENNYFSAINTDSRKAIVVLTTVIIYKFSQT